MWWPAGDDYLMESAVRGDSELLQESDTAGQPPGRADGIEAPVEPGSRRHDREHLSKYG